MKEADEEKLNFCCQSSCYVLNIEALLTHTIEKIKKPLSLHSCDLFAVTE